MVSRHVVPITDLDVVTDLAAYVVRLAPLGQATRHAGIGLEGVSIVPDGRGGASGSILFPRRSMVSDAFSDSLDMADPVSFKRVPTYGSEGDVFDAVRDVASVAELIAEARTASLDVNGTVPPMRSATT